MQAAALYVNSANYTAEVRAFFGDDLLVPYQLILLNVLSPHRFLASSDLLAAVTPIHAHLLQCLRQYLEDAYGTHSLLVPLNAQPDALGPRSNAIRPMRVDAADGTLYGEPSAALAALAPADRQRFLERLDYSQIRERAPLPSPSDDCSAACCLEGAVPVDWRWLFDLCVAALNDVRVDEVCTSP